MTFWHWPGISPYTAPCGLAGTCVFDKQSPELFCCNRAFARQSLFRSYGRFIAEFLNAISPVRLGLLDHPTGVGLRYGLVHLSGATIFLETERDGLTRPKADIWDPCSTLPADLPAEINVLHVPRAFNAHAPIFPLRHAAPRMKESFSMNIAYTTLYSLQTQCGTGKRLTELSTLIL